MSNKMEQLSKDKTARKVYTVEEAVEKTKEYFDGDSLAATVWVNKYALKDSSGNIYELTPTDMHWRLANELARIESKYSNPLSAEEIFGYLDRFKKIVPQGSPMAGIGNDMQVVSVSNCFVIDHADGDSYGAIMKVDEETIQLMKRRGGVGNDLSSIRPAGTPVKNAAITSTGIVPFMERYSNSTREVAQDGRRGARMLTISIKHPEAEAFINAKMDMNKVTGANVSVKVDDEFMRAVVADKEYTQQWPIDSKNPKITKVIKARELWNKLVKNNHTSAEPGILFWSRMIEQSLPDCYADLGFKTVSTNPCVAGETLVNVADGRGFVSIKDLAEIGEDVPVFCLNDKHKITISTMRNPRITGYNVPVFKLVLDDGSEFKITGNHQFMMRDGSYTKASDINPGDSLYVSFRDLASIKDVFPSANSKSQDYAWYRTCEFKRRKSEHRLIYEHFNGEIPLKWVIHHKDFNAQNNSPSNLEGMSKVDHDKLHGNNMIGDKNPMRRAKTEWDEEKWKSYSSNMSAAVSGEKNGMYSGYTDVNIFEHAVDLVSSLGRRFSTDEWQEYAKKIGLPVIFTDFRKFGSVAELSLLAADFVGMDDQNHDPRLLKTRLTATKLGYISKIDQEIVHVQKQCEYCSEYFWRPYSQREVSFCSQSCSNNYLNATTDVNDRRTLSINSTYNTKGNVKSDKQLEIFTSLVSQLGRKPTIKEFESACVTKNVTKRLYTKHGYSWSDLVTAAGSYNHRVVSIELDGYENVYNGTVDNYHNFFLAGKETTNEFGKKRNVLINNLQCGEIALCDADSCRLLVINLFGHIKNAFTKEAKFDMKEFKDSVYVGQRLMDDIVDIELEKIQQIIDKIKSDPEPMDIKRTELELWIRIKEKCEKGRRTGLGITGEGDMLAALGLRYGSDEANKFSENVHKVMCLTAFRSSVDMAKERGAFPIFDEKREMDNPYMKRIAKADPEMYAEMKFYGRRNIALLTCAPTGTVSILTQTTSGIEPTFMAAYTRRKKINPNDKGSRVDFVDSLGDSWEEYNVFHHGFAQWLIANGYDMKVVEKMTGNSLNSLIEKSPYYKAMANDVDWVASVKLQGAVQKWICHSISKTVNLPNHVTEELVNDVYIAAWEAGCKGCTIYRDGSRTGVLIEKKKEEEKEMYNENHAPRRAKYLNCDVHRFMNKGERWIGFVGLFNDKPYEIFTGKADDMKIPGYIEKGRIRKTKTDDGSKYDLLFEDKEGEMIEEEWLNKSFDKHYWSTAKMISGILRHGMPLPYVVSLVTSLSLDDDLITTWKAGVARIIKKYIADGTFASDKKCKDCQSESVIYQEGCLVCKECGSSKCSS